MAKVVVVGAGVGGLAAAARLAAGGHNVTVCEQAEAIGGKLGRRTRDGFRFDTGPSLLTMPWVFEEHFAATGAPLADTLELEPVEPLASYRFADGTWLATHADRARMAADLEATLVPGSGGDWLELLARAEAIWQAVRGPFLERPIAGAGQLAGQARRLSDLAKVAPHRSLRGLGRAYLRDPRLVQLLDRYATYSGSDPRRAPAALAVTAYVEAVGGGWYVQGGLYRLVEALADRAQQAGARLRTGADVAAVELAAGRTSGVRLADGERLPADVVVANADAAHLYRDLLAGATARRAFRRVARTPPSSSGFALLLGLEGHTPGLAHHTVAFCDDYDAEFDALFGPAPEPVPDPTIYVAAPGDPSVAPPGHEAWFVLVNAPRQGQEGRHGPVDWEAAGVAEGYADHLLATLADRGLEVRDRVCFREVRTPADLARETRALGGAIYGTSSNGPGAAFVRPANRSPVSGLFLVGGSAHPGGGLPLVTLSARIVAGLIGPA